MCLTVLSHSAVCVGNTREENRHCRSLLAWREWWVTHSLQAGHVEVFQYFGLRQDGPKFFQSD